MLCSSACGPAAWIWRWSGRASAACWAQRVGRASYRILQEALTNALRHGTGSATVVVRHLQQEVEFTIENPISNGGEPGPERFGLTGMRERVGLLGGDLGVVADDGRFRVKARCLYDRTFDPRAHFDASAEYLRPSTPSDERGRRPGARRRRRQADARRPARSFPATIRSRWWARPATAAPRSTAPGD